MASEAQVKLSRSANIGGQTIGGVDEIVLCDYQQSYRQLVVTGSTDWEVDIPVTVANVYVTAIHSPQNISISVNQVLASTVAHQTMAVTKNVPLIYSVNEPTSTKIFTADVTKLYITNASGQDALVQVGVGGKQAPSGGA